MAFDIIQLRGISFSKMERVYTRRTVEIYFGIFNSYPFFFTTGTLAKRLRYISFRNTPVI